jgi:hypothetical protein
MVKSARASSRDYTAEVPPRTPNLAAMMIRFRRLRNYAGGGLLLGAGQVDNASFAA